FSRGIALPVPRRSRVARFRAGMNPRSATIDQAKRPSVRTSWPVGEWGLKAFPRPEPPPEPAQLVAKRTQRGKRVCRRFADSLDRLEHCAEFFKPALEGLRLLEHLGNGFRKLLIAS